MSGLTTTARLSQWAIGRMIKASQRSWWEAEYTSGHTIAEWHTLTNTLLTPFGRGASSRWEEIPKAGMCAVRLWCPNGETCEIRGQERRFFQLKVGVFMVGPNQSVCDAQLIGYVHDSDGNCACYAWETREQRLISFTDNVRAMAYRQIGPLSLEVQGVVL